MSFSKTKQMINDLISDADGASLGLEGERLFLKCMKKAAGSDSEMLLQWADLACTIFSVAYYESFSSFTDADEEEDITDPGTVISGLFAKIRQGDGDEDSCRAIVKLFTENFTKAVFYDLD